MRNLTLAIAALALASATHAKADDHSAVALPAGIWTNTEDAYFAEEEGREQPEWLGIEVGEDGQWRAIDAFGEAQSDWQSGPIEGLALRETGGWEVSGSELRKARPFSCWMSLRKDQDKPDGSPNWSFQGGLKTFDQGGRVKVGGDGAPEAMIRLRNVTWAKGSSNKPSLVLYVHKDDPKRAVSYAWASPDARMIGANLRWIQGSCSRADTAPTLDSLNAVGGAWSAAYSAQDWAGLRSLYTDDAVLMTQGQPKIEGADNIVNFLQRVPNAGGEVTFAFENEETTVDGDLGTVTAKYLMTIAFPGRDPIEIAGRSLLIYKWQDGDWKLWRDIDNLAPDVTVEQFAP